jgi:hypothetical protein
MNSPKGRVSTDFKGVSSFEKQFSQINGELGMVSCFQNFAKEDLIHIKAGSSTWDN